MSTWPAPTSASRYSVPPPASPGLHDGGRRLGQHSCADRPNAVTLPAPAWPSRTTRTPVGHGHVELADAELRVHVPACAGEVDVAQVDGEVADRELVRRDAIARDRARAVGRDHRCRRRAGRRPGRSAPTTSTSGMPERDEPACPAAPRARPRARRRRRPTRRASTPEIDVDARRTASSNHAHAGEHEQHAPGDRTEVRARAAGGAAGGLGGRGSVARGRCGRAADGRARSRRGRRPRSAAVGSDRRTGRGARARWRRARRRRGCAATARRRRAR